ncbi:MAG: tetratricopeptide repeat protein [Bacteroidetes bacterium]|nr:tetratricopeptide repeat protein [Bacteroidota bacterium]
MQKKLKIETIDTSKIKLQLFISNAYFGVQVDSVYKYASLALTFSNKINYAFGKVKAFDFLAQYYWSTGDYETSIEHMHQKLAALEKYNNKNEMALTLGNIGLVYHSQSEYEKALEYYFKALKIEEDLADKEGIARNLGNIGSVYLAKQEWNKALTNFNKTYQLAKELNDQRLQITALNNIGALYFEKYQFQKSLDFYTQSLAIIEKHGAKSLGSTTYMNIGNIYLYIGDSLKKTSEGQLEANKYYSKALQFFTQSLRLANESGDINVLANSLGYLGELYISLKLYPKAEENLKQSLVHANTIGDLGLIKLQHLALSRLYTDTKKFDLALIHYKKFISARDSIFNEANTKKAVRLEMNFEFDKKEAATKLYQEKKEAIAASESKRQQIIIWSVCGILVLGLAFSVFVYRSFLQKQKANEEILKQKDVIEEKQKEILDSIYYAKRIQTALLPSEKYIDRSLEKLSNKT